MARVDARRRYVSTVCAQIYDQAPVAVLAVVIGNLKGLSFGEGEEEGFGLITNSAFRFSFCAAALFERACFRGVYIGEPKLQVAQAAAVAVRPVDGCIGLRCGGLALRFVLCAGG